MLRAGSGLSLLPDPSAAGREAAAAAVAGCGAEPREVLVFASHHHGARLGDVLAGVRGAVGGARLTACTGYGALTEAHEIEEAEAVAVLAIAGDALALRPAIGPEVAAGEDPLVLLPGPDAGWPEDLLAGLGRVYGAGLSGPWDEPAVAIDDQVVPGGTLAIGLGGTVRVAAGHSFSLRPVGDPHQVTAARGDRIQALDGRPAAEVAPAGEDLFVAVGGQVRVLDRAGDALVAAGAEEGASVQFLRRDSAGAQADLDALLVRLAGETADKPPAFGLYFNCAARGRDLHGAEDVDVSLIRARFPGLPVIGLFGSFELAPVDGVARMHAYTGVLVLVSEV